MAKKKRRKVAPAEQQNAAPPPKQSNIDKAKEFDFSSLLNTKRFASLNKLITRDLNGASSDPTFSRYSKDEIQRYLQNPYTYEEQIRDAVIYIYGASSHFRRLIQYFVGLTDWAYVVSPVNIIPAKTNPNSIERNYRKTLQALNAMNIKSQFPAMLTVVLREDVGYYTMLVTNDDIMFMRLPSNYCKIASIEGKVFNVSFDFSYFDARQEDLEYYPHEFTVDYNAYLKDRMGLRWQELASPTSFAIKCNTDIIDYAIPPFVGILREIYDLEDYKANKLAKTALENYAILIMNLGVNEQGDWEIDLDLAQKFMRALDNVLPEEVGSALSPMKVDKISFDKANVGDTNYVADAEQELFSSAGVSSLLFNNDKASANALILSIKADQAITFGIVKSIETAINRYLQSQSYGKGFKLTFLDCSPFNRKEVGDMYLKACQYGLPMVSYYAASQGLGQAELDTMNFLENDVLKIKETFIPLTSSSTMSGSSTSAADSEASSDEGGAPVKDLGEVSDKRETNRELE